MNRIKQVINECIKEELVRCDVRRVVAEEVYRRAKAGDRQILGLVNEWKVARTKKDSNNSDKSEEVGSGENLDRQVRDYLKDPTTNVSAVMRMVIRAEGEEGKWSDDSLRSYASKLSRGKAPIGDEMASDIYAVMRSRK